MKKYGILIELNYFLSPLFVIDFEFWVWRVLELFPEYLISRKNTSYTKNFSLLAASFYQKNLIFRLAISTISTFFQIRIFVFSGMNFVTHLYWVANYLLAWKICCFINPKSASSERDFRNEFRTEHRRFLPHFPKKKSNSKSVNLRNKYRVSINDDLPYFLIAIEKTLWD